MKSISKLLLLMSAIISLLSCGETDDIIQQRDLVSKKDAHFVMGILKIGDAVKETDAIYINDLQSVLLAKCVVEINDAKLPYIALAFYLQFRQV